MRAALLVLMACVAVTTAVTTADADTSYNFLVIGDWGGEPNSPFTEPGQIACAASMGPVAAAINSQMVLALGDNFYDAGVPTNEHDPRFKNTFEKVYTAASLMTPWYVVGGNHDHLGNISAEIEYSKYSQRWKFPSYYYNFIVDLPFGNNMKAEFIMIDTVLLSGTSYHNEVTGEFVKPTGPANKRAADEQWTFIQNALTASTADYLFVAGHYPIYSACAHGPTDNLVDQLRPMMIAVNATAYLSGHDHCLEHMEDGELPYILSGAADNCCYDLNNLNKIPAGILKFHVASDNKPNGLSGGYVSMSLTAGGATASYRDQAGKVLFTTSSVAPRKK